MQFFENEVIIDDFDSISKEDIELLNFKNPQNYIIYNFNEKKAKELNFTFPLTIISLILIDSNLYENIELKNLEYLYIENSKNLNYLTANNLTKIELDISNDESLLENIELLRKFPKLQKLILQGNSNIKLKLPENVKNLTLQYTNLDVSHLTSLESISYSNFKGKIFFPKNIKEINLKGKLNFEDFNKLTNLNSLSIKNNTNEIILNKKLLQQLTEFSCESCPNIKFNGEFNDKKLLKLYLKNVNIVIDINKLKHITELHLDSISNNFSALNLESFESLSKLTIVYNNVAKINLPKSLIELNCSHNQIRTLNLPLNLRVLKCSHNQIKTITPNENLEELFCENNNIEIFNANQKLKKLYINSNPLYFLTLSKKLESLMAANCDLEEINVKNLNSLIYLNLENNPFKKLFTLPLNLEYLNVSKCNITTFKVLAPKLKTLNISYNSIASLRELSDTLIELNCSFNKLKSLPPIPKDLEVLKCSNNLLKTLPLLPKSLSYLDCSFNKLENLGVENVDLTNLDYFNASNNKLTQLPLLRKDLSFDVNNNNIIEVKVKEYKIELPINKLSFKNENVDIITLPKGTVLFRGYTEGVRQIIYDFVGYKSKNDTYMLSPSHNVFFYPYPYVLEDYFTPKNMTIFVLSKDIDISLNISPSFNSWKDMIYKLEYLKTCNEVQNDDYFKGNNYDPCFSIDFIKENKNVVGGIYLSGLDVSPISQTTTKKLDYLKYRRYFSDIDNNVAVPEIILYPFKERKMDYVITKPTDISYEWLNSKMDQYNYLPLITVQYDVNDKSSFDTIINSLLSPSGYKDEEKTYHMTIDPLTHFYVITEFCDENVLKRCIPVSTENKLEYL